MAIVDGAMGALQLALKLRTEARRTGEWTAVQEKEMEDKMHLAFTSPWWVSGTTISPHEPEYQEWKPNPPPS
jgi:hypothetical protein